MANGHGTGRAVDLLVPDPTTERDPRHLLLQLDALRRLPDALIIVDQQFRIIDWNPAAEKIFGYARGEVMGRSPDFLLPADAMNELPDRVGTLLESTGDWGGEYAFQRRDGTVGIGEINVVPLQDELGVRVAVLIVLRDITQRRYTADQIARLAAIVESSEDAILSMTMDGIVTSWNAAAEPLYGYSREEVIGRNSRFLYPPDRTLEADGMLDSIARGEAIAPFDTVRLRKDGTLIDVSIRSSPIKDEAGRICGASTFARNITERKSAEEEMGRTNEQLRALLDNTNAIVYTKDLDGRYILVNRQFARQLGRNREEVVGKTDFECMPVEVAQVLHENDQQVLKTAGPMQVEETVPMADGLRTYLSVKFPLLNDQGVPYAVSGISTDITERKAHENTLQELATSRAELLEQLMDAQEAERRRLSMEIHDGALQSLGVSMMAVDRSARRLERGEYALVSNELGLLRQMLGETVRELRAVLADLSPDVLNSHGLAMALQGHVSRLADVTGIQCDLLTSVKSKLPKGIELVMYRLAQEALANVQKHARASHVWVRLEEHKGKLKLTVADNGHGFDPEEALRKRDDGERLGLGSMRQRIQAVGGCLEIHSTRGEGTSLIFTCPLAD